MYVCLHIVFQFRDPADIPVLVHPVNQYIPGGYDPKITHEGMDDVPDTGEVLVTLSPGNRAEQPFLVFCPAEQ